MPDPTTQPQLDSTPCTDGEMPPTPQLGDLQDWVVSPDRVRVWEDEFHKLHVKRDDEEFEDVRARLVFPLSGRGDFLSFIGEKGREVVLLERPTDLDPDSLAALKRVLERTYYAAQIHQVYSIAETMGVSHWHVRTDRGFATFEVVDRNRHIRHLPPDRYVVIDADGNRFEIADLRELDEHSQAEVHHET